MYLSRVLFLLVCIATQVIGQQGASGLKTVLDTEPQTDAQGQSVGVPASDVGTPATDALPSTYSDDQMTYHVAGATVDVDTDIKITSPNANMQWVSNATNTVTWTGSRPNIFSFQLINDDPHIRNTGISLRASVSTTDGSATCDVPRLPSVSGWYIRFYDQLNISRTIAVSDKFSIVNATTAAAAAANGTPSLSGSGVTKSGSTSGNALNTTSAKVSGHNGTSKLQADGSHSFIVLSACLISLAYVLFL